MTISFAYRTFQWSSESFQRASVHCVIIGFTCGTSAREKCLYNEPHSATVVENINPYLIDAPDILIESSGHSICGAKRMTKGNQPSDGGNFLLTPEERDQLLKDDPSVADLVHRYIGSRDFINGTPVTAIAVSCIPSFFPRTGGTTAPSWRPTVSGARASTRSRSSSRNS